ncbi:hypothetical protein C8J56DRAFT_959802 [Mycena floridula]|nr:hypothetical protein C8J56DRAFT_959802 [Mycena floridula]
MPLPSWFHELEENAGPGIEGIRATLKQTRAEVRANKLSCTYCDTAESKKPLQACSQCRSVRYCNRTCQVADYKATHKQDCISFKDPPLCRDFTMNTRNPGCKFPQSMLFGRGHSKGDVGFWMSTAGTVDCKLVMTIGNHDDFKALPREEAIMTLLPGAVGKYLGLRFLVQNRRSAKTKTPVVVVGKRIQAIASSSMLKGAMPGEVIKKCDSQSSRIWLTPIWSTVTHINGKEIKSQDKPQALLDHSTSTVLLKDPGDYAIFEVQYRCGGPSIVRDFEALEQMSELHVPYADHDPDFRGSYADLKMETAQGIIDQSAIAFYYEDYKTKGEYEHVKSHYGEARAKMLQTGDNALTGQLAMMMEMMMNGMR